MCGFVRSNVRGPGHDDNGARFSPSADNASQPAKDTIYSRESNFEFGMMEIEFSPNKMVSKHSRKMQQKDTKV